MGSYNLPSRALAGRTIVVDHGHGGADPGTVGVGKTTEADNVLAIAGLKLLLEQAGARVILSGRAMSILLTVLLIQACPAVSWQHGLPRRIGLRRTFLFHSTMTG